MRLEMLMILVWVGGMFCQLFVCDTEVHCTTIICVCYFMRHIKHLYLVSTHCISLYNIR